MAITKPKEKAAVWPTTVDNPFDPFTEWDKWLRFDEQTMQYHTCERVAALAATSNDLTDDEYDLCLDQAIATLINLFDSTGLYELAIEGKTRSFKQN